MTWFGRIVAAALSIVFVLLAIPFIALEVDRILNGGPLATSPEVVLVVYSLVTIAVTVFWVRKLRRKRRTSDG